MRRLLGLMTVSFGVVGIFLTTASVFAQAQKAAEPAKAAAEVPDADAPFKPAPVVRRIPNLDYFISLNDRRYRPHFLAEYHFIRTVCSPSPEQLKAIARDGERLYQVKILKSAKEKHAARIAGKLITSEDEPSVLSIRSELIRIAKGHLTPEQAKRLEAEEAERIAQWRRLEIEGVLDMIDHELILGDGQRDEIRRALESSWQDDWILIPGILLFSDLNDQRFPPIPDACVERYLTENQRKAWGKILKGPPTAGMPPGVEALRQSVDNPLEDDATREAHEAVIRAGKEERLKQAREINK